MLYFRLLLLHQVIRLSPFPSIPVSHLFLPSALRGGAGHRHFSSYIRASNAEIEKFTHGGYLSWRPGGETLAPTTEASPFYGRSQCNTIAARIPLSAHSELRKTYTNPYNEFRFGPVLEDLVLSTPSLVLSPQSWVLWPGTLALFPGRSNANVTPIIVTVTFSQDGIAGMAALRYVEKTRNAHDVNCVTVAVDRLRVWQHIDTWRLDEDIEYHSTLNWTGRSSMEIGVVMRQGGRKLAETGHI